jgi:hypothetical protein
MAIQSGTIRYTCVITTVDPNATTSIGAPAPIIEGAIKSGKAIQICLYNISPAFRWPVVGETWMVIQYNGSWYLDGLFPQQTAAANSFTDYDQGDLVLNSDTGKVAVVGSIPDADNNNVDFEIFFNGENLAYSHAGVVTQLMPIRPGALVPAATATYPGALLCDGQFYPNAETDYPNLFANIHPAYKSGSGLRVPKLTGRVPLGAGVSDADHGTTWDIGNEPVYGPGGEQSHVQLTSEITSHTHTTGLDISHGSDTTSIWLGGDSNSPPLNGVSHYGGEAITSSVGSSTPMNILPPVSVVNWFIVHGS